MPNSRHRRFSVRNGIAGREPNKIQDGLQTSSPDPDPEIKITGKNLTSMKSTKSKSKLNVNSPRNSNNANSFTSDRGISSISIIPMNSPKGRPNMTADKDVTADSSTIDLFNIMNVSEVMEEPSSDTNEKNDNPHLRVPRHPGPPRERTPLRREKHRQHRITVRSPKRRAVPIDSQKTNDNNLNENINNTINNSEISDTNSNDKGFDIKILTKNTATEPIDWTQEVAVYSPGSRANSVEVNEEDDERQSDHSFDDMCRICHGGDSLSPELGQLISACSCRGTVGRVHVKCLERWLTESGKSRCELCGTRYVTRRVHRYGVLRALVMWILSQNAKQLMVDSLGIMLMSPLAVLAAWLSGRTLAGLMSQDPHATPWPLASTFVLACMTLVCYYCWIVSAATRHALGWWIWYRSQYEVRLRLQNGEN